MRIVIYISKIGTALSSLWLIRGPFCRQQFTQLMISSKRHPMTVEYSCMNSITMDGLETAVRIMIFRSKLNNETIGVKSM